MIQIMHIYILQSDDVSVYEYSPPTIVQFPSSPIHSVPLQVRNHASSVSLHWIMAWSLSPCNQALCGGSKGEQPTTKK